MSQATPLFQAGSNFYLVVLLNNLVHWLLTPVKFSNNLSKVITNKTFINRSSTGNIPVLTSIILQSQIYRFER